MLIVTEDVKSTPPQLLSFTIIPESTLNHFQILLKVLRNEKSVNLTMVKEPKIVQKINKTIYRIEFVALSPGKYGFNVAIINIIMRLQDVKVTFLTPQSLRSWGGGERWIYTIANLLQDNNFQVTVLSLSFSPNNLYRINMEQLLENAKFKYEELPFIKSKHIPLRASKFPKKIETDVAYVIGGYFFYLKQVSKIKIPMIYGFHDPALQEERNYFQRKIVENILPNFKIIHVLNRSQQKILTDKARNVLLPNTWLYDKPPIVPKYEKFTVLFFGRHEKYKGIETLKYVMNNLPLDINLVICGSGTMSDELRVNSPNINFLGFVPELKLEELISKSHAVLFPSYSEASSLVSIETLAHYTPVVYRRIDQNEMLFDKELCMGASTDAEFLQSIIKLKEIYDENKENYITKSRGLFNSLMSKEEYLRKFIECIIKPAISD